MLVEKLVVQDKLNSKIWDSNNRLREEVKEAVLKIANEFVKDLKFDIDVTDIHIVGSNASYNYTENSDLDVHLIVRFDEENKELEQQLCALATSSFNKNYDIGIHGVNVEIYVEDIRSTTVSNGVYSVLNNEWIKFPKKIEAKEYDNSEQLAVWKKKIEDALIDTENNSAKTLLDNIYLIRKNSIDIDGEYGRGNQLFKDIRSLGLLQKLKDKVAQNKGKELSVESVDGVLTEDTRARLISKSKTSKKGMQRFNRRVKSKVANTVKQFNSIDMNKLFKDDILTVNISVNGETDDYTVRISFGGFLDILHKEISRNGGKFDLRSIIRALVAGFNQENVYVHCSCCLHPSTKIRLWDDTISTVEEIQKRLDIGERLYAYSVNEGGFVFPGLIEDVYVTKTVNNFTKVVLDSGDEILTTVDHRYMLEDGSWEEAQNLSVGQKLTGINFSSFKTSAPTVASVENIVCDETPVYDVSVKDYHNFAVNACPILHNCDFKYRFDYWATVKHTNSGSPQNIPSNITNPDDSLGSGCKHTLLVLNNNAWIIKVASVINNYVKYMQKNYEKLYADIIYPAIYGKAYDGVQLGIFDDEKELATDTDTDDVSKAIDYGKKSTQFQKGNKQGYKFVSDKDKEQAEIDVDAEETEENS